MSEWDKSFIAKAFKVSKEENNKYIIFITTDAYGISIDNSYI